MAKELENYETVKTRKKQFYVDYPDGRIIAELIKGDEKEAQFKATVFKNIDDQRQGLAFSTGYAQEFKGTGGFANNTSWLENCEESAIGRALDNAGYNNLRCSKEEMEGAKRNSEALNANDPAGEPSPKQKPSAGPGDWKWPFPYPEGMKGIALSDLGVDGLKQAESSLLNWKSNPKKKFPDNGQKMLDAVTFLLQPKSNGASK